MKLSFDDIELPSNKKFGLFFTFVFAVVCGFFYWKGAIDWALPFGVLSGLFLIIAVTYADILRPLNIAWMGLGLILGMIIGPIVLGILFFLLITPVALVTKLFGRDELLLKMRASDTHWRTRDPLGPDGDSFRNQF